MTGWTPNQVRREMTLPLLSAMQRQWGKHPPVHLLVAGFLKYKAPEEDEDTGVTAAPSEKVQDMGELISLFGQAGGIVKQA